jgi:hypothetical protein
MSDEIRNEQERLAELRATGEAVGKLAGDAEAFRRVVDAYRARDAERFQTELARLGLIDRCRLICRWLCNKHCVFICRKLCGPIEGQNELDVDEMLEFAKVTERIAADEGLLKRLVAAVDQEDAETFQAIIKELQLGRFCHQLCHYLCAVRCRLVCKQLCPPLPTITKVSHIPTSQFNTLGMADGPSSGTASVPFPNKPAGVGDHPIGASANIRGVFGIANPFQYKVEYALAPAGPWTPILQPVHDFTFSPTFPTPPLFTNYTRVPNALGWYNVSEMGLAGFDYLTDWVTSAVADGLYYLRLTVRNAMLAEFSSPLVPVLIDNTPPDMPSIDLQMITPDGKKFELGCCEEVKRGEGNVIAITLKAADANFSSISVSLLGGCGASMAIVATDGTPLSKTYNGNIADTGYPVATTFLWDPWKAGVDPCCYLIYVTINDRAVLNDAWSGGHARSNWHSITIA